MIRVCDWRRSFALVCGLSAALLPCAVAAKGFHVLYSFPDLNADGASPHTGLARDTQGNLYGTTFLGGGQVNGNGTVFRLARDGTETVLHAFEGGLYSDGDYPNGRLVADSGGNFFGTTEAGGIDGGCNMNGCGTIFEIAADGTYKQLYIFTGGNDGAQPMAALLPDGQGGFYGTADEGGANRSGAVFHLTSNGAMTTVYSFAGGSDGNGPESDLVADKDGNLYGTTVYGGGSGCMGAGCGTAFKISSSGSETVLHAFTGGSDGGNPIAGLVFDKNGNLYGAAEFGGNAQGCGGSGCGTIFKLGSDGSFNVLYTFTGGSDGGQPGATLIRNKAGDIYGTTLFWGASAYGVVFKITPDGTEQVLHAFRNGSDGAYPWCTLLKVGKNELTGTASGGGAADNGTIFRIRD